MLSADAFIHDLSISFSYGVIFPNFSRTMSSCILCVPDFMFFYIMTPPEGIGDDSVFIFNRFFRYICPLNTDFFIIRRLW